MSKFGARRDDQHAFPVKVRRSDALGAARTLSPFLVCRVSCDEFLVRSSNPFEGARYQIAVFGGIKIEGFARAGLARIGCDATAREKLQPPSEATPQGEVTVQELSRASIAHGDTEAVTEMVFGVSRHVDAMATAFRTGIVTRLCGGDMSGARFAVHGCHRCYEREQWANFREGRCLSADPCAIPASSVLAYGKYAPRDSPPASLGFDRNTPAFSAALP
jgi:hypothetical protein